MRVVEDHADTAYVTARLLRSCGYDAVVATSRREAFEAAAAQTFDLVLCDVSLADGSGVELMRELNATHGLSGIALTGWDLRDLGPFLAVLLKPVKFETLHDVIRSALTLAKNSYQTHAGPQDSPSATGV